MRSTTSARGYARRRGVSDWLVDKSDLVRLSASRDADAWADQIQRGLMRISTVTRLELGYSARNGDDLRDGMG